MGKLTAKLVDNLTEPCTYEDGDGLRLVVTSTGRKNGARSLIRLAISCANLLPVS